MKKIILLLSFCLLSFSPSILSQTISEIQGNGAASPYEDTEVSTFGVVTATHGPGYFIQDGTGLRSGIYVYDDTQSPTVGDLINITGTVVEYYELTEIKDITAFEVVSSGNPLPDPLILTTAEVANEDYEGVLATINKATCTNTDLGFGEWEINDGSGSARVDDAIFAYTPILNNDYSVTGPITYSFSNYKILPRSADDVTIALPLYFVSTPLEVDIATNSLTIEWQTNVAATSNIEYGLTPNLELGTLTGNGPDSENHSITINGLTPATVYYIKAYSTQGNDQTPSQTQVVSTASNSTGAFKVYFNHPVDHSLATNQLAVSTEHIVDTIISYIDRAQTTLDITMYEIENEAIVNAINAAHNRGVTVRYITDDEGNNAVLDNLNQGIPLVKGNKNGIMHDKFMIVDRDSENGSWVMTGSMNHTVNNLGWDYNNIICIQDQALANAFNMEFNEMWGSNGNTPDTLAGKFGADKTDNTPHRFLIGGKAVSLFFSPTDGTAHEIQKIIDAAENEVAFAILVFTENSLGTSVKNAHDAGLDVKGIIDYVEFNGSEYEYLLNNGVDVQDYQNADGSQWPDGPTLHHKYAIVDYSNGDHPTLITGSHNWTASANSIHDENTLIIQDATLANLYYQEFGARFNGVPNSINEIFIKPLSVSPNPTSDLITIQIVKEGWLRLMDSNGSIIENQKVNQGDLQLSISHLPNGIYFLQINDQLAKVLLHR